MVTIDYNPTDTGPTAFRSAISDLGYTATIATHDQAEKLASKQPSKIIVPDNAPKFFVDAVEKANTLHKPIIIDFWASWCSACLQLKHETLEHPTVTQSLSGVELIYIDLDKYPALGEIYGVIAIPDVFFINETGVIIDRLQHFEPPEGFNTRVRKILNQPNTSNEQTIAP